VHWFSICFLGVLNVFSETYKKKNNSDGYIIFFVFIQVNTVGRFGEISPIAFPNQVTGQAVEEHPP